MTRQSSSRRGFTLTEVLFALILFSLFGIIAAKLFHTTMKLADSTAQAHDTGLRLDHAVAAFRNDAWTAPQIEPPQENRAVLGDVTWSIEKNVLRRTDSSGQVREWALPGDAGFSMDGSMLILNISPTARRAGDEWRVVSEMQLLAGLTS